MLLWLFEKICFIYSFLTAEKDVQVARNGRGGRGNSGNARKKTFFFEGGVPLDRITVYYVRLVRISLAPLIDGKA